MDDDMQDQMNDLLAHSLEGNALGVKDVVDALLSAKAVEAMQAMKIDVAQSIYGTASDDQDVGPEDPLEDNSEESDWTDDDVEIESDDQELDDLFAELEDLTDESDDIEADEELTDNED